MLSKALVDEMAEWSAEVNGAVYGIRRPPTTLQVSWDHMCGRKGRLTEVTNIMDSLPSAHYCEPLFPASFSKAAIQLFQDIPEGTQCLTKLGSAKRIAVAR